jgi:hypothetical protein
MFFLNWDTISLVIGPATPSWSHDEVSEEGGRDKGKSIGSVKRKALLQIAHHHRFINLISLLVITIVCESFQ